jgi:hypothetical protein
MIVIMVVILVAVVIGDGIFGVVRVWRRKAPS